LDWLADGEASILSVEALSGRSCSFPARTIAVSGSSQPQPARRNPSGNADPGWGKAGTCTRLASAGIKTQTRTAWHVPGTGAQIFKCF